MMGSYSLLVQEILFSDTQNSFVSFESLNSVSFLPFYFVLQKQKWL